MADWLQVAANESIRVTLKNIVDEQDDQSFDFHKVNNANRKNYLRVLYRFKLIITVFIYSNS